MARFQTVKDVLTSYLRERTPDCDVWYQPSYRNVCAFAREHLLVISFEVHYAWFDEPEFIHTMLVENRVYEQLISLEDPLTTILSWAPAGLRVQAKIGSHS